METFVGDVVRISLLTGIDLTGYTLGIKFKKPDGTGGLWNAVLNSVNNTIMYYDTNLSDLDMEGKWQIQSFVEATGRRGHGKIIDLEVFEPLTMRDTVTTIAPTTLTPTTPIP